jgi:hypothetical protein
MESWNAEHGYHRVANELLGSAGVTFDHASRLIEVAAHHPPKSFRTEPFAERSRASHVRKNDHNDLAPLRGMFQELVEWTTPALAKPRPVGVDLAANGAALHGRILGVRSFTTRPDLEPHLVREMKTNPTRPSRHLPDTKIIDSGSLVASQRGLVSLRQAAGWP